MYEFHYSNQWLLSDSVIFSKLREEQSCTTMRGIYQLLQYCFTVVVSEASVCIRALQTKEEDSIFSRVTPLQLCNSLEVRSLQPRAVWIG